MIRHTISALAAIAFLALPGQATTIADRYSSFWVFGDSLSDTGNIFNQFGGTFPPPPYFDGNFTNGPVWADAITATYAPGTTANLAFGGAKATTDADIVPDFTAQRAIFEAIPKLLGDTPLAAVWFGSNDVFGGIGNASADPANAEAIIGSTVFQTVTSVVSGILDLASLGIEHFIVPNLPNLGLTPRIAKEGPLAIQLGTGASLAYNGALATALDGLGALGLNIYRVDVFSLFNDAIGDPGKYGMTDVAEPCLDLEPFSLLFGAPLPQVCDDPDKRLFWDVLHPTAVGHAAILSSVRDVVPVPLPAGGLLLVSAIGLLALRRRAA